jgi:hypothetical protein
MLEIKNAGREKREGQWRSAMKSRNEAPDIYQRNLTQLVGIYFKNGLDKTPFRPKL